MPKLERGRIVRVEICDPQGRNPKKRPLVIVHPTDDIKSGEPIVCVAITGEIPTKVPSDCVLLPYHLGGHPRTGLKKRCAALCSWLVVINEGNIIEYLGRVPDAQMRDILRQVDAME